MIKHIPMYCYSLFCKQIKAPVPTEECWECRNFCTSCYRYENAIGKRSARSSLISKLCNLSNQFMKCATNQNIKALKDVAMKSFGCFNEYKISLPTRSDRGTHFFSGDNKFPARWWRKVSSVNLLVVMRLDLLWWLFSIHSPSLFQFLVAHYFSPLVLWIQMKISTTINFTPFTEHFYCMFRMTFSLNVDHNFLPVTCVPENSRLLEVLQTRPLKLVIKIRDHIFYLFSPFSFSRWNWRLLLRKKTSSSRTRGKFISS